MSSCPRCGKRFFCSPSGKCWCFEVDVPVDVQERIAIDYDGCLCPACLKELTS